MNPLPRVALAVIASVAGAVLVSLLQIWSRSVATPFELVGRPVIMLLLCMPSLLGRSWGRWLILFTGGASALWLFRSAATAQILQPFPRALVALAGIVVLASSSLPLLRSRAGKM